MIYMLCPKMPTPAIAWRVEEGAILVTRLICDEIAILAQTRLRMGGGETPLLAVPMGYAAAIEARIPVFAGLVGDHQAEVGQALEVRLHRARPGGRLDLGQAVVSQADGLKAGQSVGF